MDEWINVKDKLPENKLVLANTDTNFYIISEYNYDYKTWWTDAYGEVTGVTHWMPLPEPPK